MSLVRNLFRKYAGFSLEIPEWEIADLGVTALWGPSGSGKSSVIRLLCGLEAAAGMSWTFKGQDLALIPPEAKALGVVFQTSDVLSHLTVTENLVFAARARNIEEAKWRPDMEDWTERLGLESLLNRRAEQLSGGERQRLALLNALIGRPRFLFLDEPFSHLDQERREAVRSWLKKILNERHIPALLVTHDLSDLEELADYRVRINEGRLK